MGDGLMASGVLATDRMINNDSISLESCTLITSRLDISGPLVMMDDVSTHCLIGRPLHYYPSGLCALSHNAYLGWGLSNQASQERSGYLCSHAAASPLLMCVSLRLTSGVKSHVIQYVFMYGCMYVSN